MNVSLGNIKNSSSISSDIISKEFLDVRKNIESARTATKGEKGDAGPRGAQGVQGPTGPQGPEGPQGPQGEEGIQGIQGLTGPQGVKGDKGDTGDTGSTGATGLTGAAGAAGVDGTDGVGVPTGGTTDQVLAKASATDYDTTWVDQTGGSGGSIGYDEVTAISGLSSLTPSQGDWAKITGLNFFAVYLNSIWRKVGTMTDIIFGNLYGESAHYDASQISGLIDGQAVTNWADQSGNGYSMTPVSTGAIYKESIVNGLPVVRFDGTTASIMRIAGKIFGNVSTDKLTIVIVAKNNTSSYGALLSTRLTAGWSLRYQTNTNLNYYHVGHGSVGNIAVTSQFNIIWVRRNSATSADGGKNSTTNILSASPTGFSPESSDTWTQVGTEVDGNSILNGDIAELFIFEDAISDTVLNTVISDLMTKYSIT